MTQDLKSEKIEIRITPSDKLIITASADNRGITASDLVREAALKEAKKK
jgi:uncharacterized protein (DUF1778 family)